MTSTSGVSNNLTPVFDVTQSPTYTANLDAARVNAFYTVNTIHDFTYR